MNFFPSDFQTKLYFFENPERMRFSTFFSFHIHYQADFGQTVMVVGDHSEFGAWDVNKGIILDWNEVSITN